MYNTHLEIHEYFMFGVKITAFNTTRHYTIVSDRMYNIHNRKKKLHILDVVLYWLSLRNIPLLTSCTVRLFFIF